MDLLTFENTLKEYFPKLTWDYIDEDGSAGAHLSLGADDLTCFIDPSLSIYRYPDGEWSAKIYLNDGLIFTSWEDNDLRSCLSEIKDHMRSIQSALNNSL